MSLKKIITIVGATGQQGGAVVRAFLKRAPEFALRAVTRNPSSDASKALTALGVEVVEGDFDKAETLTPAFLGAYGAFLVTDFFQGAKGNPAVEIAQGKTLVDAVKSSGCKHVVWSGLEDTRGLFSYPPVIGDMPIPHFDGKGEITRYLTASGVPSTTMLTVCYFDNLNSGFLNATPQGLVMANVTGDAKVGFIATDDIGSAAVGLFLEGPGEWAGKTLGIAGEFLSFPELAGVVSDVIGRPVNYYNMPEPAFVGMMSQHMPPIIAQELTNMFAFYREREAYFRETRSVEVTKRLCGGTVIDARTFVTQNKDVLSKK